MFGRIHRLFVNVQLRNIDEIAKLNVANGVKFFESKNPNWEERITEDLDVGRGLCCPAALFTGEEYYKAIDLLGITPGRAHLYGFATTPGNVYYEHERKCLNRHWLQAREAKLEAKKLSAESFEYLPQSEDEELISA